MMTFDFYTKGNHSGLVRAIALGASLCLFASLSACSGGPSSMDTLLGIDPNTNTSKATTDSSSSSDVSELRIIGGNFQIGAPGGTFSDPLKIQLLENGQPTAGKAVSFTVSGGTTSGTL